MDLMSGSRKMDGLVHLLSCLSLSLGVLFSGPLLAETIPEPEPIVRGIPAGPGAEVVAFCPDIGEWSTVYTARDGSGLPGRLASGRYKVYLVDPWNTVAARVDGFDGVVRDIYPAVMDRLKQLGGGGPITWVGHGLCGLLPVAAAARANLRSHPDRWIALGTRFDYSHPSSRLLAWLGAWRGSERPLPEVAKSVLFTGLRVALGPRRSSVPSVLAEEPGADEASILEGYHRDHLARSPPEAVLEDLARWYATGELWDQEGWTDYARGFDSVKGPALLVAGASDPVAPPESVLAGLERLPDEVGATFHLLSRVSGDREEYGHLGMLLSRHSARDVDGLVAAWLQGRRRLP